MEDTVRSIGDKLLETAKAEVERQEDAITELKKQKVSKRNQELHDAEVAALESQKELLEQSVKDFESSYEAILKSQDNFAGKLKNFGDLVRRTKVGDVEIIGLGDIQSDIDALDRYGDALETLKARGVSQEFLDQIVSMNIDDAIEYTNLLLSQTESAFNNDVSLWGQKQEKAKEIAERFYSDQLGVLKSEFTDKVMGQLGTLPDESEEIGYAVGEGIADGLASSAELVEKQAAELVKAALKASKKTGKIQSPSKVFRDEVGKMMAAGVEIGWNDEISAVFNEMKAAVDEQQSRMFATVSAKTGVATAGSVRQTETKAERYNDSAVVGLLKQIAGKETRVVIAPSAALGRACDRSIKMYGTVKG